MDNEHELERNNGDFRELKELVLASLNNSCDAPSSVDCFKNLEIWRYNSSMPSIAGFPEHIQVMLGQVDQRRHSCRGAASGRDGCCRFNLGKSEEAMGI